MGILISEKVQGFSCYHDNEGHICWPQSLKSFWSVSGPPIVESRSGDFEPARRVNGQFPIDKVLITFTLQHWDTEERKKDKGEINALNCHLVHLTHLMEYPGAHTLRVKWTNAVFVVIGIPS